MTMGRRADLAFIKSSLHYASGLMARGVEVVAKFGLYALAARTLGGPDAGLFFMCLTILAFVSTAARLGIERPAARHVAAYLASGQAREARRTIVHALSLVAGAGLVMGALIFFSAGLQEQVLHQPGLGAALRLLAIVVPLHVLTYAAGAVLIGLDKGAAAQFLTNALAPAITLIAFPLGLHDLRLALIVYMLGYTASCLWALGLIARRWRSLGPDTGMADHAPLPPLLKVAGNFSVADLALAGLISVPVLILARFVDATAVGQFSVANRLSMLVATVVLSIATIGAPAFAGSHRLQAYDQLRRIRGQIGWLTGAVCLPAIAAMILLRHPLLGLMKSDVPAASEGLVIMALGQLAYAMLPGRDTLLAMSGHGAVLRTLSLIQVAVCIVGGLYLCSAYGMIGASAISAITWIIWAIGCEIYVRVELPQLHSKPTSV
jgi:O-antigen/teichoic acid export membrane protein